MRPSRAFRPASMLALEGRVVLSQVLNPAASLSNLDRPPANVAQTLTPADMVPGAPAAPTGGNTFPLSIGGTLEVGLPIYEQRQTLYTHPATVQLVDELIAPNPSPGGYTTTEWISLKNNGGNEKVVNVKTVSGNTVTNQITTTLPNGTVQTEVETAVASGNVTTHTNITTLPSGTVDTNTYTDVQEGNKELIEDGSSSSSDGYLETYSGVAHTVGDKTTTHETYTQSGAVVKCTTTVVTSLGDSGSNETILTTQPHHRETITKEDTTVWRLNPPAA